MNERERADLLAHLRTTGINVLDFERDVLRTLPEDFVLKYEMLWLKAFGTSNGKPAANPIANARRVTRVSTNQTETRGGAKGGKGGVGRDIIANEPALRMKQKVDRKLRAIARDLKVWLHDVDARAGVRRCSRCKKYAEDTWTYCPWDGAPTEEQN